MTAATHPLADRRDHCQRLVAMYFVSSVGDYAQFSIRCEMREGALRCLPPRFKRDIGSPQLRIARQHDERHCGQRAGVQGLFGAHFKVSQLIHLRKDSFSPRIQIAPA